MLAPGQKKQIAVLTPGVKRDVNALFFTNKHQIYVGITRRDTNTIPVFRYSLQLHTFRDKSEVGSAGDNIF
jgi:hypothetical protein